MVRAGISARTGIQVAVDVPPDDLPITHAQATALFRIYQETLTNVARHANASHVQAILTEEPSYDHSASCR